MSKHRVYGVVIDTTKDALPLSDNLVELCAYLDSDERVYTIEVELFDATFICDTVSTLDVVYCAYYHSGNLTKMLDMMYITPILKYSEQTFLQALHRAKAGKLTALVGNEQYIKEYLVAYNLQHGTHYVIKDGEFSKIIDGYNLDTIIWIQEVAHARTN